MNGKKCSLLLALAVAAPVLVSCGRSPARPTTMSPPDSPEIPPVRLTGRIVDSASRGIAGARVALHSSFAPVMVDESISDAAGGYLVTVPGREVLLGARVTVEKQGFEAADHWISIGEDPPAEVKADLRLYRPVRIDAGQNANVSVYEDDPQCGDEGYYCRRIRVVAQASGFLTAELPFRPNDESRFIVGVAGQSLYEAWPTLRVAVEAGSETLLDVVRIGSVPASTTLRTRLE